MKRELVIEEIQAVSLEILKNIADICEKENIRYYLGYGTLIGAVRHHDYIPWDDDVDIIMPRKDYNRFLKYMNEHIHEYPYLKVFNPETCSEYPYMITRISDDRYRIVMDNEQEYGMGIFVDVYPYDGLGDTKKEAVKFGLKGDHLSSFCYQATRVRYAVETTKSPIRKILKFPVFVVAKLCGKDIFQKQLSKLAGVKDYDRSNYVGCVVWLSCGERDIYERKLFDEYEMMPFGKYEFRVPKEYDKVLRQLYGDYMQLPPEKDRVGHHNYQVYEKQ